MTTPLLAYIAAINTIIAAAFVYEVRTLGPRYRTSQEWLMKALAGFAYERVLHSRVNGKVAGQHRVKAASEAERDAEGHEGEGDLAHALNPAGRLGRRSNLSKKETA